MLGHIPAPYQLQWEKYQKWSNYKMCSRGILCNQKDKCPYRHLPEQQVEHKSNSSYGYNTLLDEVTKLHKEDMKDEEAQERAKFLGHILADHGYNYYHLPCSKFGDTKYGESACQKTGYLVKEQGFNLYISKLRRMHRNSDPQFLKAKLSFGKYEGKTWAQVEKFHPGYINWLAKDMAFNCAFRDIVDAILERRRMP